MNDDKYAHLKGKFVISDGGAFLMRDIEDGGWIWTDVPERAEPFASFQEALNAAHTVPNQDLNSSNVFGPIQ